MNLRCSESPGTLGEIDAIDNFTRMIFRHQKIDMSKVDLRIPNSHLEHSFAIRGVLNNNQRRPTDPCVTRLRECESVLL